MYTSMNPFWNGREHLTVDNGVVLKGQRIVVPASIRQSMLPDLHASHHGIVRPKLVLAKLYIGLACSRTWIPWSAHARNVASIKHPSPRRRFSMTVHLFDHST